MQQTLNLNNEENPKQNQSLKIKYLTFSNIIQLPSWYIYIFLSQAQKKKIIIMFSQYLPFFLTSYFCLTIVMNFLRFYFFLLFFFINISAALEFHLIYLMYYLMMFYLFIFFMILLACILHIIFIVTSSLT